MCTVVLVASCPPHPTLTSFTLPYLTPNFLQRRRIITQIKDICAILSGLQVAVDYRAGQKLVADKDFTDNKEFFRDMFELGRRYKIMNPEKMRSEVCRRPVFACEDFPSVTFFSY